MSTTESTAYLACVVHVPLFTMQEREINADAWKAYDARVAEFRRFDPDLVIVFGGDHYDNVFLNLAPQFMIGHSARAVDDCGGKPGELDVPMDISRRLADHLVGQDFDIATSYDMGVDHGFSNVLGHFLGELDAKPVIPVHVNALSEPRPTMRRVRQLGEAIGAFARTLGLKVAFLGSGGLSHQTDDIFPQYDTARDETLRDYIVSGGGRGTLTRAAFMERIQTDMDGLSGQLVSGAVQVEWINEEWDRQFLATFAGDLTAFDTWTDEEIVRAGGGGGSEIRQWVAAAAAAQACGAEERVVDYYSSDTTTAVGVGIAHSRLRTGV